ncbi:endonuclease/exonuclease/phosphatase family protein [Halobacteriovorax sp.]|uniref:endonuclease/exonuclease/phosphatase family protein n=1 Tax=Halobacteriovorax sp. TaxID=2020862 RepID=UPI003565990C
MLKVASTNIRFDNPADKPNDWAGRKELLTGLLNKFSPDIIGTQEGREPQLKDLESLLSAHKLIDLNREWIDERMYPCIFVNPKTIDVIDSGDIWLSETPFAAGSKSFESAFPRLCTWIQARVIETGKDFFYVNTHLDHVLGTTRKEQIQVLINEITKKNSLNLPVVLTGDFNESPSESVREVIEKDWQELYDPWQHLGRAEETSFHKFDGKNIDGSRIDWILVDKSFSVKTIQIVKDHEGEIYPSDHYPVFASFTY